MTTELTNEQEHDIIQKKIENIVFRLRKATVLIYSLEDNREGSIKMSSRKDKAGLTTTETEQLQALGWYVKQIYIDNGEMHIGIKRLDKV